MYIKKIKHNQIKLACFAKVESMQLLWPCLPVLQSQTLFIRQKSVWAKHQKRKWKNVFFRISLWDTYFHILPFLKCKRNGWIISSPNFSFWFLFFLVSWFSFFLGQYSPVCPGSPLHRKLQSEKLESHKMEKGRKVPVQPEILSQFYYFTVFCSQTWGQTCDSY